ncbi:TPA: winged helix-turn-helix transcriptional regulator [Enterobacter kobei]
MRHVAGVEKYRVQAWPEGGEGFRQRFGDLLRAAAPITQKELTKQLRLFEQRGLVTRTIYPEIPPRVEYQIIELGLTLQSALKPQANWMRDYGDRLKR